MIYTTSRPSLKRKEGMSLLHFELFQKNQKHFISLMYNIIIAAFKKVEFLFKEEKFAKI